MRGCWRTVLCVSLVSFLSACGEIHTPTARQAITHPFGTAAPFTRGTSKAEILEEWGPPDHISQHGIDELGNLCEEWIYRGRLQGLPIDVEYVSRTKHLFFEGNNLVRCESEDPPGEKP